MKKLLIIITAFLLVYGCNDDENPTSGTEGNGASAYYPGEAGSQFVFAIDTFDVATASYFPLGTRTSTIVSGTNIGGTEYYLQRNVLQPAPSGEDPEIYFRRSDTGIYFYVDTLGLAEAILEIDDSLAALIDIVADPEIIVLSTPLEDGKLWDAYKLNLDIPSIGFTLSIVELSASYEGVEYISTPATNGIATEAVKIKYEVILRIPDDPANLFAPVPRNYMGYGWYIQNVGLTMAEGNGVIVNALSGGEFNLDDTLSVYRETLTSYNIIQ